MSHANDEATANKTLVLRFMELSLRRDFEGMKDCMAEECIQIYPRPGMPGMPPGVEGRANILEFLSQLSTYQPGSHEMEVENVIAEGSLVVVQFKLRARTARGEPYENYHVQFVECHSGKIVKTWEYCDTLYATQKLLPGAIGSLVE